MSQWMSYLDDPRAAGIQVQAGLDRLSGVPTKPNMVALCDGIFMRHTWSLADAANFELFTDHFCRVMNGLEIQRRAEVGGDHLVSPMAIGEYLHLQYMLWKATIVQNLTDAGGETGVIQIPLWLSRYPWDIDAYACPINQLQVIRETRGGASAMATVTTDIAQLIAEGRHVGEGSFQYKPRSWFVVQSTARTVTLPGGWRYHFIAIMNMGAVDANLFDAGLNVSGPNVQIMNIDGQDLQRKFAADYKFGDVTSVAQDDDAADSAILNELADYIQPVYAPMPQSIRYEDGLIGPVTIQVVGAADPAVNNIFCCACPM